MAYLWIKAADWKYNLNPSFIAVVSRLKLNQWYLKATPIHFKSTIAQPRHMFNQHNRTKCKASMPKQLLLNGKTANKLELPQSRFYPDTNLSPRQINSLMTQEHSAFKLLRKKAAPKTRISHNQIGKFDPHTDSKLKLSSRYELSIFDEDEWQGTARKLFFETLSSKP